MIFLDHFTKLWWLLVMYKGLHSLSLLSFQKVLHLIRLIFDNLRNGQPNKLPHVHHTCCKFTPEFVL